MIAVKKAKGPPYEKLLSFHLHRHVAGTRKGRSLKIIHASDVTKDDWCPRKHALMMATNTPPRGDFIGTAQALSYDVSSTCARTIVRWATEAGLAIGDWMCARCSHTVIYGPQPEACPKCKAGRFWYMEHRFTSELCGIGGAIDLLVALPALKLHRVIEIKALAKDAFKGVKMPLAEHRERTNLYLRLIEESNDPAQLKIDTSRATILYMTKGGYGEKSKAPREWGLTDMPWTPFKEFVIERDDEATQALCDKSKGLWQWMRKEGPMPDGVCPSAFSSTAQHCQVVKRCFSGEYK